MRNEDVVKPCRDVACYVLPEHEIAHMQKTLRATSLRCFEALVIISPRRFFTPICVLALILFWPPFAPAQENAASIIQHSAEVNERDWAAVPEFDNSERDRTKDGDKTYAVTMLYGSPYNRLIAVSGRRLSDAEQKQEQA